MTESIQESDQNGTTLRQRKRERETYAILHILLVYLGRPRLVVQEMRVIGLETDLDHGSNLDDAVVGLGRGGDRARARRRDGLLLRRQEAELVRDGGLDVAVDNGLRRQVVDLGRVVVACVARDVASHESPVGAERLEAHLNILFERLIDQLVTRRRDE